MRLLFLFLLFFVCRAAIAQRYVFAHWGTDDGLPTSTVNHIAEDPLGFIWLATDGAGLVRFDGTNFGQPFHPDSLPSPFVKVIEVDVRGNFWLGTERGPAYFNGVTLKKLRNLPAGLKSRINGILPFAGDSVWIASRNGLFLFDGKTFSQPVGKLAKIEITSIVSHANGLLVSTAGGLFSVKNGNAQLLPTEGVKRLIAAGAEVLLVTDLGTLRQRTDGSTTPFLPTTDFRAALWHEGALWLGSATAGLTRWQKGSTTTIAGKNGLQFDRVRALYRSKNGSIWVGSTSGLARLTNAELRIYDTDHGLPDARIHAICTTKNGDTWVGTATGVSRFRDDFTQLQNFSQTDGFPEGLVLAIAEDGKGTVWFGTERGLASFNGQFFTNHNIPDPFVFALRFYRKKLYIGTASGLFTSEGGSVKQLTQDGQGFVQLVEWNGLLFGVTLAGQVINISAAQPQPVAEIFGVAVDTLRIHQLLAMPNGGLAIAAQGVGVFVGRGNSYVLLAKPQGLQSLNLKAMAASATQLFIGTEQGLYSYPLGAASRPVLRFYGPETGFLAKECNERCLVIDGNSQILAGTNSGLYRMGEASFTRLQPNRIVVTQIDMLFQPNYNWLAEGDSVMPWTAIPNKLTLPFDRNYLTFHFAAPQASGQQVFIRYKLAGQDKIWTKAGTRREAVFTNIQPGRYTFVVQQSASPNFTEFAEASIPLTIIPPIYRTWWFWLIIAALLGSLVFFGVRYRINQLNARLALEAALADSERKALRLQMNPHFVFNALDAISGFIFKNEPKEAVRYLTSFAKLMRLTLESSRVAKVPLHNELQLLKNYIELEQLRFNNAFSYTLHVAEEIDPYDVYLPPMLVQPFVENAILHGLRNRVEVGAHLNLSFALEHNRLLVVVEDNGVGREKSAELTAKRGKTSLATSITTERIDLLSKSLGQKVELSIIDLKNEAGHANGTRVELRLPLLEAEEDFS